VVIKSGILTHSDCLHQLSWTTTSVMCIYPT